MSFCKEGDSCSYLSRSWYFWRTLKPLELQQSWLSVPTVGLCETDWSSAVPVLTTAWTLDTRANEQVQDNAARPFSKERETKCHCKACCWLVLDIRKVAQSDRLQFVFYDESFLFLSLFYINSTKYIYCVFKIDSFIGCALLYFNHSKFLQVLNCCNIFDLLKVLNCRTELGFWVFVFNLYQC